MIADQFSSQQIIKAGMCDFWVYKVVNFQDCGVEVWRFSEPFKAKLKEGKTLPRDYGQVLISLVFKLLT